MAAILYDSIVLIAIWIVVAFLVTLPFGIEGSRTTEGNAVVTLDPMYRYTLFAAMLLSGYLFFGWFWTHSGQTIGMQAWKLKVQNADGSAISWKQVALRYVTAPFALALVGVGYFWMLFDTQKRVWPDIASGSVVAQISNFPNGIPK